MGQDALADEILKEKASRRAALRAEYWKQVTSPYRHGTGEGGHIVSLFKVGWCYITILPLNSHLQTKS